MQKDPKSSKHSVRSGKDAPGYPPYPREDDIYSREEESSLEDSDDPKTEAVEGEEISMENDLDVPGSELDDDNEDIGEEDEENNYYSLGGEEHDDPEPEE